MMLRIKIFDFISQGKAEVGIASLKSLGDKLKCVKYNK